MFGQENVPLPTYKYTFFPLPTVLRNFSFASLKFENGYLFLFGRSVAGKLDSPLSNFKKTLYSSFFTG